MIASLFLKNEKKRMARLITVVVGLTLPIWALGITAFLLGTFDTGALALLGWTKFTDFVPALYTERMVSPGLEVALNFGYTLTGAWCLLVLDLIFTLTPFARIIEILKSLIETYTWIRRLSKIYYVANIAISVLFLPAPLQPFHFVFLPGFIGWNFLLICFYSLFLLAGFSWDLLKYVFKAYPLRRIDPSRSCFFMPCAPQSISDSDQAGPLFVGLILFVGGDVILPIYLHRWMRQREANALQQRYQSVSQRDQSARRTIPNVWGGMGYTGPFQRQISGSEDMELTGFMQLPVRRVNSTPNEGL